MEMLEPPMTSVCDVTIRDRLSRHKKSLKGTQQEKSHEERASWETWLKSYGLKSLHETSISCHESHIHHGYRPNPASISYCLRSVFHPTNETLNVWTHGVPCILMILHYHNFAYSRMEYTTDPLFYPYWFFAAGVVFTLFGSACAHMFNCLSPGSREVCFCCDYGVIALQAIGVTCSFTFYLCPYSCVTSQSGAVISTYTVMMVGNMLTVVAACYTRYPNIPHRNLVRVFPYVFMYTMLSIPCVYKYSSANIPRNNATLANDVIPTCGFAESAPSSNHFVQLCAVMFLGAVFQALKLPERWWPGKFDIIGHSHQIFHLLTASGLYYQTLLIEDALEEAMQMQEDGLLKPEDLKITWLTAVLIPTVSAVISCAAAVFYSIDLYKSHIKAKQ